MRRLFFDESAQATTEYILMLAAAMSFFMLLYKQLLSPIVANMKTTLVQQIQSGFFGANFHSLNVGQ